MVKLSEIPRDVLMEIERFVKEMKGKVPVTTSPREDGSRIKTLVDLVEEKFGYRLSPSQIYALQRGEKTYRVKLPIDVVRDLERRYGSVGKGIKKIVKFYEATKLPTELEKAHQMLLYAGEVLTAEQIEVALSTMYRDKTKIWKVVSELAKRGYIFRDKQGKYIISRFPRNPLLELGFGLFG